tara:strand:+ start:1531 stop:2031 length:501 start_codon:yes stop_codon:yes gene_type:complete
MSCEYCEEYHIENKEHQMSLTHQTNEYNHFNSLRGTQVDVATWGEREQVIDNYKDILDNDSFDCPISSCDFVTLNKDAMLEHEANCFGARITEITQPVNENFIACKDCGKKFYDKGQKLKPKYALKHHQQTCSLLLPKKIRANIKKQLSSIDNLDLLKKIQALLDE